MFDPINIIISVINSGKDIASPLLDDPSDKISYDVGIRILSKEIYDKIISKGILQREIDSALTENCNECNLDLYSVCCDEVPNYLNCSSKKDYSTLS